MASNCCLSSASIRTLSVVCTIIASYCHFFSVRCQQKRFFPDKSKTLFAPGRPFQGTASLDRLSAPAHMISRAGRYYLSFRALFKRVSAGNKLSCTALKRCKCRINACCPSRAGGPPGAMPESDAPDPPCGSAGRKAMFPAGAASRQVLLPRPADFLSAPFPFRSCVTSALLPRRPAGLPCPH